MRVRIAVSDPLPLFRSGMMSTLREAGYLSEDPDDLLEWMTEQQRRAVLITLYSPEDWTMMRELVAANQDLIVVALLTDSSTQAYVQAVRSGAATAVPRDAPVDTVRRVFEEALVGRCVLPIQVVKLLAAEHVDSVQNSRRIPSKEINWLRELANGSTVAELAEKNGYSERAMFRLLRNLYARMNVRTRTEALIKANREGWL
jgi:DNA-binding NarL/FixJ family response regulator